jgi:hypothetical protein
LFEPCEVVEIVFDRLNGKRSTAGPTGLKFHYLAEWRGLTPIGSL